MKFKNLRNYEILNDNPRLVYVEADYIGAKDDYAKCIGYVQKSSDETICIFSADRTDKLKNIYKKCILMDFLKPKEYEIIKRFKK